MRLVIAFASTLGLVLAAPLAAQTMIGAAHPSDSGTHFPAPQALAPNEVLFEVRVVGVSRAPADQVFAHVNFTATAETSSAARTEAEDLARRLAEAARRHGAERVPAGAQLGFPGWGFGSDAITIVTPVVGEDGAARTNRAFAAAGGLRLRLGDPDRFDALRVELEQIGVLAINGPIFILNDDAEERRAARLDAMTKAREEAELFARAQNMRVARLIRFSEDDGQAQIVQMMMRQFGGAGGGPRREVETNVAAEVAFALAPQ